MTLDQDKPVTFKVFKEVVDSESEMSDSGESDGSAAVEESSCGGEFFDSVAVSVSSLCLVLALMLCERGHTDCNRFLALLTFLTKCSISRARYSEFLSFTLRSSARSPRIKLFPRKSS